MNESESNFHKIERDFKEKYPEEFIVINTFLANYQGNKEVLKFFIQKSLDIIIVDEIPS